MKFALSLLLLLSFNASANTVESVYTSSSILSSELKEEVISAIENKFPCVDSFGIKEVTSSVEYNEIDQGIVDEFYTSKFKVNYHFDFHPNTATVTVKSILWDGSNPTIDWTEIESIEGNISCD